MPLHAERKARCIGDPDGFDGAVFRNAFDDDAFTRFEDALPMQGIHTDGFATKYLREGAAGRQSDVMPVSEDDRLIGVDFAVLQPWHAMVHTPGYFTDFGMQRAPEGDVHLLQAAADPEYRDASGDASFRQRQCDVVAMD